MPRLDSPQTVFFGCVQLDIEVVVSGGPLSLIPPCGLVWYSTSSRSLGPSSDPFFYARLGRAPMIFIGLQYLCSTPCLPAVAPPPYRA